MFGQSFVVRIAKLRHRALFAIKHRNAQVLEIAGFADSFRYGKEEKISLPSVLKQSFSRDGRRWFTADIVRTHTNSHTIALPVTTRKRHLRLMLHSYFWPRYRSAALRLCPNRAIGPVAAGSCRDRLRRWHRRRFPAGPSPLPCCRPGPVDARASILCRLSPSTGTGSWRAAP